MGSRESTAARSSVRCRGYLRMTAGRNSPTGGSIAMDYGRQLEFGLFPDSTGF